MRDRSSSGFTTYYDLILQRNYLTGNYSYKGITWKTPEHSAVHSSSPSLSEMHDKISTSTVSKGGDFSSGTETHCFNYDWIRGSCSENKAQSFGPFDQRSLVWWRRLVYDLVILSLRDHRVAHCHHRQELADLSWRWLKDTQNQHDVLLIRLEISFSFRKTYVVLFDVLDESRVIKLGGVIAVGRQVAARPKKQNQTKFSTTKGHSGQKSQHTFHFQGM